eukprot:Em0004g1587a
MHSTLPRAIEWSPPYQLCTCGEVRVIYYTLAQALLQHQDPTCTQRSDKCDQMLVTLRHSLSDEQRKTINDKYTQHLIKAKAFCDAYNANIEEAEKEWGRKRQKEHDQILGQLESRALISQQRGTLFFRTPRKVQVFGVCCEPLCHQVFFLIDKAEQAGKGAGVVVSLVHAFFHLHGLGERRVTLQADNCVGQNKNTTMMWYLAWRVITGQHDTIQLNLMLPGHTKFRPDSYFGLFKKYYRRQDHVDDMDDLADCVRQCRYYTFRFDRKHPGVMKMKTLPSDANPTEVTMLRAGVAIMDIKDAYQSQVMPPVITTQWIVPDVVTVPAQGPTLVMLHPYQKATNLDLQLPFLTHLLLSEGHESAEDTYSEVQDGEDGCVSGSALYVARGMPVARLYKMNTHKLPAVPCDEHGDATKADNSSGATKAGNSSVDKGSQGPSKRRRRKKSEIDRPFSCSVCGKKYGALYTHNKINKTKHGS